MLEAIADVADGQEVGRLVWIRLDFGAEGVTLRAPAALRLRSKLFFIPLGKV